MKLKQGMSKTDVNLITKDFVKLKDEFFMGNKYPHDWLCICGNTIKKRTWISIYNKDECICITCKENRQESRYKHEVEKDGEYEYVRSFKNGEILPSGEVIKTSRNKRIQVKHKYCGGEYVTTVGSFINLGKRCGKCCGSYDKSFAHHIEVELGEPLEKYWDFEKNTVNPYHISKGRNSKNKKGENTKIWIKCKNTNYHGTYEVSASSFCKGHRCTYCDKKKVHPKDSFAQYHIDNTDPSFLEKYWDYEKNTVDPWEISVSSNRNKVWIKCQSEDVNKLNGLMKKDYHDSHYITCKSFTIGNRCGYCGNSRDKVHLYDSFGYHNFDKVMSWHPDNDISPFRISYGSKKKVKFICHKCKHNWMGTLNNVSSANSWCPKCNMSEGEMKISKWLRYNNINCIYEKSYHNLIGFKGGSLSYDFYLPSYNLLIEYQGRQHEEYIPGLHRTYADFEQQQEHDRRKRKYAKDNGIELLEIHRKDFNNIEKILNKEINKI